MVPKQKYDPAKTEILALLRRKTGLSQDRAAEFFGFSGSRRRGTMSAWELGYSRPRPGRRTEFVLYLCDELNLGRNLELFRQVWDDVMVDQWGWKPLGAAELGLPEGDLPESIEPLSPVTSRPFQLPPTLHSYIPRGNIQRELDSLLQPRGGMVALHGTAGAGKSVIAVHAAHQWGKRFPDGVLWLDLRRQQDVAPALRKIAAAYGYARQTDRTDDVEHLAAFVRTILQDRQALIVLDNVEDIQPRQFELLLPGTSRCLTLVTSRRLFPQLQRLAHVLLVESMDDRDAGRLLAEILGRPANEDETTKRLQLVRRLGGLPLALDIAARRMQAQRWSSAQILDRLDGAEQTVAALTLPLDDDDPQHSVARAFASSYDLLDTELQRIFRALAVMAPGDFSIRAVAFALDLQWRELELRLEALGHLALARLAAGSGRWDLHPLLRNYGETLARGAGEWEELKNRHLAYFVGCAGECTRDFPALEAELDNFVEAARWSWESGEYDGVLYLVDRLYTGGGRFLDLHRHTSEAILLLGWATEIDWRREDHPAEARHLRELGAAYQRRGIRSQALDCFESALALQREIGDRSETAACLNAIGGILTLKGDLDKAFARFEEALAIRTELGDGVGIANCRMNMGIALKRSRQPDRAQAMFEEALERLEELEDKDGRARCLLNLGNLVHNEGDAERAMDCYERSLSLSRELGDRGGIAVCLYQQGIILQKQGKLNPALRRLRESLALARDMGDLWGEALALEVIGEVLGQKGDYNGASDHLEKALAMARELGDTELEADCLKYLELFGRGSWDSPRTIA